MEKATTQLREKNGRIERRKTTNMYFPVILRAILSKVVIEKECQKFGQNGIDLIQA